MAPTERDTIYQNGETHIPRVKLCTAALAKLRLDMTMIELGMMVSHPRHSCTVHAGPHKCNRAVAMAHDARASVQECRNTGMQFVPLLVACGYVALRDVVVVVSLPGCHRVDCFQFWPVMAQHHREVVSVRV